MSALYQSRALADAATEKLKVYAQPQRLMILSCLLRGEKTVGAIDIATGIGQPALSQQLAELRRAEMVRTRREAKQVFYGLADDKVGLCVRSMEAILGDSAGLPGALGSALLSGQVEQALPTTPAGAAAFARIG
ncbi:metalloregulator ArsR/SmtB family transcription factor [Sphingobium sp. DEHP117]|jgi:DNA-binding transcriptional ArsR family regulator|uniref:ArsR/SmtB family transcription factor n=1 Tax=Sphingobium sp. DEHP117 TaxID=2993436 RepID=UPI0027D7463D|nr:metalloregulator ArsR/SmtB family transcription factor [Sphingobium sp. DEHP117]MDQ4418975.1 metalloregulator ArsR/SmtB family transcription factor [Sphingobium sp. DEHP117]